jgi:hypothetical protein
VEHTTNFLSYNGISNDVEVKKCLVASNIFVVSYEPSIEDLISAKVNIISDRLITSIGLVVADK